MRTSEDRSGLLVTCIDNTGRSPVLTGELVPVDWHGLPVQVTNSPDRSSEVLIGRKSFFLFIKIYLNNDYFLICKHFFGGNLPGVALKLT